MLIQRFRAAASLYIDLHCRPMDEPYGLDTEADGVQPGAGASVPLHHRPALADERIRCNAVGQVMLKLKRPSHDGTAQLVMSALEFLQHLAALVQRARLPSRNLASHH